MKKILAFLSSFALWIAWIIFFHVTGAAIWGGFIIAFFSSLGIAKITGVI
ncbi:MAG: hypothetical protein WC582_03765 [Patescibacteria group bacterium]